MTLIVAIIGSRDWPDLPRVRTYVERIAAKHPDATIISGGAYGVDRAAEETADTLGLGVLSCRPIERDGSYTNELVHNARADYLLGKVALGYIELLLDDTFPTYGDAAKHRNTIIVQNADHVVAFWTRFSRGTLHAINHAHKIKRPVHIYRPEDT